jgi:hypothetical protein
MAVEPQALNAATDLFQLETRISSQGNLQTMS